jgi:hypothetical protein
MKRLAIPLARGLARVLTALGAGWLTCWGRWRLFRGDADGAARALETAARRRPGAFAPLVHLARACLRRNDLYRARRALAQAREASPDRFAREAETWVRREGFDVAALTDAPVAARPAQAEVQTERRTAVLHGPRRVLGAAHPYGDCRDLDEYARFSAMPPISHGEIAGIDIDELADDLQDG